MDKTININIAGTLFQIDDEAYRILRDYLQAISNHFKNVQGGHETIDDIEYRIAEIFQSQKGLAGAISKENVAAMISIIGKPEDFDHFEQEASAPIYTTQRKRMYRNPDDSIISGVCGGIGAYLNSDPVLFRILFVISAFFGIGFFVYIALWIALPSATTDAKKRDMYGDAYNSVRSQTRQADGTYTTNYQTTSKLGNAFNEIFSAIGRVLYIILRVFLIIIGIVLVLTGFLFILSYVMIFVFKYPGAFSFDSSGFNLINFRDFLNYIVTPSASPWIIFLTSIALLIPMLALIYWGVKMIFWFKAKDGILSLAALVLWVMALAALAIIMFNEGTSFAKTANTTAETILTASPDTLYITTDRKISELKYQKEFTLPHEEYSVFINVDKRELFIRPNFTVESSNDKQSGFEVKKRSSGMTDIDAMKKIGGFDFNCDLKGDTLRFDEYFTLPAGQRWAADNININLYIPTGKILKLVNNPKIMFHSIFRNDSEENLESSWESGNSIWVMTDEGLKPVNEKSVMPK
jgi:phage shock protein PspC (stress-responsive transcriptional regulator)